MSSIGPKQGGERPRPLPLSDDQKTGPADAADDDSIEILEVVGMQEHPDEPPLEGVPPPGSDRVIPDGGPAVPVAALEGAEDEKERLHDQLLRSRAELENVRKRTAREKAQAHDVALGELMGRLLPVIDNLERALQSAPPTGDPFHQGIRLIYQQLMDVLARDGLAPIDTRDANFDPHLHEAAEMVDLPGWAQGRIIEELQRGYRLKERLLRPALVKVASGKRPGEKAGGGEQPAG